MSAALDLTTAARAERDALADRTDVLDKVGVLRCLPGDMHVMTVEVANFYQVPVETIRSTVNRNREEFDDDGYQAISRGEFEGSFKMQLPSSASTVALFPRRAVLRIGMLLRDSPIARQVRDYLLDAERAATPAFLIPQTYSAALRLAADEHDRAELAEARSRQLEQRIERDQPLVAKAEAHTASASAIHRQEFAREIQAWGIKQNVVIVHEDVYAFLRHKGMLVDGQRSDRNHATAEAVKRGWAWTDKGTTDDGHPYATTKLLPAGQDIAWKWITKHVGEHRTLRLRVTA